jgi:transcriptional regulator with XRE-family HTH domain
MISRDQIRAARALLDWSQPQLAERAGVSTDLISKIENGVTDGSLKTINKIQVVFEGCGIEFLDHSGVRFKPKEIVTYKGHDGFVVFLNDVYDTMRNGGSIYVTNVDEREFFRWSGEEAKPHMARMQAIEGLTTKIIVKQGDNLHPAAYAEYRRVPEEQFGRLSMYIYGKKTALINFEEDDVTIYIIHHENVTAHFKSEFTKVWNDANKP